MTINWQEIQFFNPDFPSESVFKQVEDLIEPNLMLAIDRFRGLLGARIDPSPLPEAWARHGSPNSQHNVVYSEMGKPIRLSSAGDVFPTCDIRTAFQVAAGSGLFGGIGVYFDTNYGGQPRMMMHLDIRKIEVAIWWARVNGVYIYAHRKDEQDLFFKAIAGVA
jgi:hypothetical protein